MSLNSVSVKYGLDRKVMHNNFFLRWYCGCDFEISPRYSLKFSLQTQCFFMFSSSEKSVNYANKNCNECYCRQYAM